MTGFQSSESIARLHTAHPTKEQIVKEGSATEHVETFDTSANTRPSTLPIRIALFALRFYKSYLSMLLAGSCRFDPTCSQFTYQAVERFGVLRGSWLGFKRLLRCQPLSRRFGFDPVPEEWPARSAKHKEAHS